MKKGWLTALPIVFSGAVQADEPAKPSDFDFKPVTQLAEYAVPASIARPIPLYTITDEPQFRLVGALDMEKDFKERLIEALFSTDRWSYNEEFDGLSYDITEFSSNWRLQFLAASDGNGDIDKINKNFPVMPHIKSFNGKKIGEDDPALFLRMQISF